MAVEFDVPLEAIADRARTLAPASHRGEVVRLGRGVIVVDDSYNANPTATRRALDVMAGAHGAGRRVAVLGEMLELGDEAVRLHEEVGRAAAGGAGSICCSTVGGAPAEALGGRGGRGRASRATGCGTSRRATRRRRPRRGCVAPGDLVLVKGSRGVRTDRVVDRLRAEFA